MLPVGSRWCGEECPGLPPGQGWEVEIVGFMQVGKKLDDQLFPIWWTANLN
jgi:hypothetical protein